MGFEQPSFEQPKSELDTLKEEIEKTQNEILATDPDAPEAEWLKEKLQDLDKRLSQFEKPELRTQETYGGKSAEVPEIVEETEKKILGDQERKAS